GQKTIARLRLEPSQDPPPPPPPFVGLPTVLTSKEPGAQTSTVKITCTDGVYVGWGSKIRGQDPTQPGREGGAVIPKGGKTLLIDGWVEGGDASGSTLFHRKGGDVTCGGSAVGSPNHGGIRGGSGSSTTGNIPGGDGGTPTLTGDGIKGTGKIE